MSIPYYHIDTFTDGLFRGNPAGVCFLPSWLPDHVLQSIAAENALAETAFVVQTDGSFHLRWFTPTVEVDLCGHATLAPAHVLFEHFHWSDPVITFATRSGPISVTREGAWLTLDFPSRPATPCEIPEDLLLGLGAVPVFVAKSRDYMAVFDSASTVETMVPDMARLCRLDSLGVIITAPAANGFDFVSRFFAPRAGVPEDPVTGSAHSTLIPYWSQRLGKNRMIAKQVSQRGGLLQCEARGERVGISGQAITYGTGFLHISSACLRGATADA
jgi:PhzF family phenazine biosynthesis protein